MKGIISIALGLLFIIGVSSSQINRNPLNVTLNPNLPNLRNLYPSSPCRNLCHKYDVLPAIQDPTVANSSGGHVLYLFSGQLTFGVTEFVWDSQGGFLTLHDDSALLEGRLVPLGGPSASGFFLRLSLHLVYTADGLVELTPTSLVNPSAWTFYSINSGSKVVGFGDWNGTELEILQEVASKPFQIGVGASGKNLELGSSVWIKLVKNCTIVAGDFNLNLNCSTVCPTGNTLIATAAEADPAYATDTGGFAFTFFNPPPSTLGVQNWVFSHGHMHFTANSLHLSGTLLPFTPPHTPLYVDLTFTKTAPPASPKIELQSSAYVPVGPIDPSKWEFYDFGTAPNTIIGSGFNITITRQPGAPPFQVGWGANGKNLRFGGGAWFDWEINGQIGSGDINIDLNCPNATNSTAPPSSACQLSTTLTLLTSWTQNGQNYTEWDVTITNTGTSSILDADISFTFPVAANCGSQPGGTCVNDIWEVDTLSSGYQLPSYATPIAPGKDFTFGGIFLSSTLTVNAEPVCSV